MSHLRYVQKNATFIVTITSIILFESGRILQLYNEVVPKTPPSWTKYSVRLQSVKIAFVPSLLEEPTSLLICSCITWKYSVQINLQYVEEQQD